MKKQVEAGKEVVHGITQSDLCGKVRIALQGHRITEVELLDMLCVQFGFNQGSAKGLGPIRRETTEGRLQPPPGLPYRTNDFILPFQDRVHSLTNLSVIQSNPFSAARPATEEKKIDVETVLGLEGDTGLVNTRNTVNGEGIIPKGMIGKIHYHFLSQGQGRAREESEPPEAVPVFFQRDPPA